MKFSKFRKANCLSKRTHIQMTKKLYKRKPAVENHSGNLFTLHYSHKIIAYDAQSIIFNPHKLGTKNVFA